MIENNTSQSVKQWGSFAQATRGTSDIVHLPKDIFIGIAAKYQRSEQTLVGQIGGIAMLKEALEQGRTSDALRIAEVMEFEIDRSLSFDPLA